MATPKQPPPKQPPRVERQPAPPYTERLEDAMSRFNTAISAFNAWNTGYREVWMELIAAARELRACGVFLPAMPGEQMQPPPAAAPADMDAELKAAISAHKPVAAPTPVTSGGAGAPKTTKE
jgi:hypothetical protein